MEEDDKPFACPEPDCGMRFANEDHLSVHRRKHEMSLALAPGLGKSTGGLMFVDQTPTPTKFLKNCEEIGLFSELSKNPFEEAFKKATAESLTQSAGEQRELFHKGEASVAGPDSSSVNLETPHPNTSTPAIVPRHVEPEYIPLPGPDSFTGSTLNTPTPPVYHAEDNGAIDLRVTSSLVSKPPLRVSSLATTSSNVIKPAQDPKVDDRIVIVGGESDEGSNISVVSEKDIEVAVIDSPSPPPPQPAPQPPQPLAVIAPPSVAAAPEHKTTKQHTQTTTPAVVASPAPAKSATYAMQVLLQLPNGQTIPVQIPAAITGTAAVPVSNVSTTSEVRPELASRAHSSTEQPAAGGANPSLVTKQKLKAAITQNVHQSVLDSNMRVMSEAAERVSALPARTSTSTSVGVLRSPPATPRVSQELLIEAGSPHTVTEVQMQAADTSTPFSKRLRKSPEEDPDERRRKFLERNRAAAARCRQKRKVWIVNLEKKAEEMQAVNAKLQMEVSLLRAEVAQLKSLLLAHKDCPIFIQQRNAGQIDLETADQQEMIDGTGPIRLNTGVIAAKPLLAVTSQPTIQLSSLPKTSIGTGNRFTIVAATATSTANSTGAEDTISASNIVEDSEDELDLMEES